MAHRPQASSTLPRVLLAEDDTTSRHFLAEALRSLGCQVQGCADGAEALAQCERHDFDLLILDCRMPHAGAEQIISHLRDATHWPSHACPAVATSADITPERDRALRDHGFVDVLQKPLALDELENCLQRHLAHAAPSSLLDDEAALLTCGNADTLRALRRLFLDELDRLHDEWQRPPSPEAMIERLHRLKASCGFCGARALAAQAQRLRQQTELGSQTIEPALHDFLDTLMATRKALAEQT
ncbi:response regulator [Oleiagrimonas sp. C23AA]|uniref:response regulator n=1 Tax=Oleiagrimonas sp. C23AA TaxID=2719047 RepID=UPI0019804584|nr:response regulator [Oleiagrimonas sp. C23AA]